MPTRQATSVLRHIRNLFAEQRDGHLPDRQLLEQFTLRHDQAAFEALLRRHGPLVMGVCRRVLQTIKGYLVGRDDKPVARAQLLCGSRPAPLERKIRPLPVWDGHFELRGCDPKRTYPVLFLTAPYKPGI